MILYECKECFITKEDWEAAFEHEEKTGHKMRRISDKVRHEIPVR